MPNFSSQDPLDLLDDNDDVPVLDGSEAVPSKKIKRSKVSQWIAKIIGSNALAQLMLGKADLDVEVYDTAAGAQAAIDMTGSNRKFVRYKMAADISIPDPVGDPTAINNLGKALYIALLTDAPTKTATFSSGFTFSGGNPNTAPGSGAAANFPIQSAGWSTFLILRHDGTRWSCDQTRNRRAQDMLAVNAWNANQYIAPDVPANDTTYVSGALTFDARSPGEWERNVNANVTGLTVNNLSGGMRLTWRFHAAAAGVSITLGSQFVANGGPYNIYLANIGDYATVHGRYSAKSGKIEYIVVGNAPAPVNLGYITWANLQATYADGSPELAALALGTTAYCDMGSKTVMVVAMSTTNATTPNKWSVDGRKTIYSIAGTKAAPVVNLSTGARQVMFAAKIPAGLLNINCAKAIAIFGAKRGTGVVNANLNLRVYAGTTGGTSDTLSVGPFVVNNSAADQNNPRMVCEFTVAATGATGVIRSKGSNNDNANIADGNNIQMTQNLTADLWISVQMDAHTAGDNALGLDFVLIIEV